MIVSQNTSAEYMIQKNKIEFFKHIIISINNVIFKEYKSKHLLMDKYHLLYLHSPPVLSVDSI